MASSLASQLKKVRSHNAARLAGGKSAQRIQSKSYLFPPSVASLQDYQTLHGLALNGWSELCSEDPSFVRWNNANGSADLLFGDNSKDLDRLTKTKEENAAIDEAILEFLYLIGDRMLDRSSAKCLEWLVRRFRVHEYNVEMILSAFIPYHESVEFARMLNILELKDKAQFAFLLAVQKKAVPLPSSVLMSTLLAPPSTTTSLVTLRWIMGLVQAPPSSSRSHILQRNRHTVLSFWLSTIVKLCSLWSGSSEISIRMGLNKNNNKSRETREDDAQSLLTILLPAVLEFIGNARAGTEAKESSVYGSMAVCAIANAFDLSIEAGSGIITSLASTSGKKQNGNTALLIACACVIQQITKNFVASQSSTSSNSIPRMIQADTALKLAQLLLSDNSFKEEGRMYDLDPFFYQLTMGLTDALLRYDENSVIENALESIFEDAKVMFNKTATRAISYMMSKPETPSSLALIRVLSQIRQRHPQIFESAFKASSKNVDIESRSNRDSLMGAILALQAGSVHNISDKEGENDILWLGMQDADPTSRLSSLRKLLKHIKEGKVQAVDKFAQDLLASTLSDDNAEIVGLLYEETDILIKSLSVERIINEIRKVLEYSEKENKISRSIITLHTRFLAEKLIKGGLSTKEEQWNIWATIIWPKLLLFKRSRKSGQTLYSTISEVFPFKDKKSLTGISARLRDVSNAVMNNIEDASLSRANEILVETIAKHVVLEDQKELDFILTSALPATHEETLSTLPGQVLALLTLSSLLKSESPQFSEQFCGKIVSMLKNQAGQLGSFRDHEAHSVFEAVYSKPSSEKTKGKVFSTLLFSLAKRMPLQGTRFMEGINSSGIEKESPVYVSAFFEFVLTNLMNELNLANSIIEALLERMRHDSLEFLSSIWSMSVNGELAMTPEIRLMALRYAHTYLYAQIKASKAVDFQTVIPSFLVALHDNEKNVRLEALASLQALHTLAIKFTSNPGASETESIYGYDALYGPQTADSLTYLDSADAQNLLKNIVDARQSFINDPAHLASWMNHNLTLQIKEDGKKLTAYKVAIIHYLSSHILCWQNSYARLCLLQSMSDVSCERKLSTLLPLVKSSIHDSMTSPALLSSLMGLYDKSVKSMIKSDEQGIWTLFKTALGGSIRDAQICAASTLQKQLYTILPRDKQREIILFLTNLITNSPTPMPKEVRQCLYSLPVQADMITSVLSELRKDVTEAFLSHDQPVSKRTRIDPAEQEQDSKAMQSLRSFIELLETTLSRKPSSTSALLVELFDCLRLGIDLHLSNVSTNAEHVMQIAMSNLTVACSSMDSAMKTEVLEPMRVDTLINVVKTPCRPYTFQQALDLLALIGKLSPDLLLHHSMPIFTFVGSTMMQRDDEHSFTVIERTLESILPPVVADIRRKQQTSKPQEKSSLFGRDVSLPLLQSARPLLCVFTDAATHVPRHRRQNFFHLLANVMGVDDFLAPICLLLIDRQAYKVAKQLTDDEAASALQLPLSLFERAQDAKRRREAAIDIQLGILMEVWNEAMRTWQHRSDDPIEMQEHVFLDCVRNIESEHESRKVDPIKRIVALLRFGKFAILDNRTTLSEEREDESDEERNKRDSILHMIIQSALTLTRVESKSVSVASQEALDEVMTIVSVSTLNHVVNTLVDSKDSLSKRSGLQIFASAVGAMSEGEREQATSLVPNVIKTCSNMFSATVEDKIVALDTLSAICEQPQSSEHYALSEIISDLGKLAVQAAKQNKTQVTERSLDVLRKLSEMLGPRLIPKLVELVGVCEKLIERAGLPRGDDEEHQQQGAFSVLVALTRSVPTFMSTHLKGLFELFIRSNDLTKPNKSGERKLLANIVRFVNVNDVLQTVYEIHKSSTKRDTDGLVNVHMFCLDVVQSCTRSMDKRKTVQHYKAIFRFLLDCFDLRRRSVADEDVFRAISLDSLADIESKTVGVFVRLVFRLNETTFRPLFLRLCDWALVDLGEEEGSESNTIQEQIYARQTVLYKVLNALMEELGELISHYYVNVLDSTIETLNNGKLLEKTLWEPMLTSVKLSSKVDKGTFWNQLRAKKMLNALIAQLRIPSSPISSSSTMERLLSDSICSLCQTVSDEVCLKTANNLLLDIARQLNSTNLSLFSSDQQTNFEQQKIRIISVQMLEKLWRTKGGLEDGLLGLVPETVPSIAELLQSGDEEIQQAMTGLVSAIEEILGENLDAYLQ